jgi:hypothetical protein
MSNPWVRGALGVLGIYSVLFVILPSALSVALS